jgi:hypothetical protein
LLILVPAVYAPAQVSFSLGISTPHLNIGINMPSYPQMVPVPDSPVYYAPGAPANYFFYDGMYWVFKDDNWYASTWYNGPWGLVQVDAVPPFLLRVPVRYYRFRPAYFHGWAPDAPPRWGDHWGPGWTQRHPGWDRPGARPAPVRAQLPDYQRQYQGARYPAPERQPALHNQNYHYQPQEPVVRGHYEQQGQRGPGRPGPGNRPEQGPGNRPEPGQRRGQQP